MKIGSLFSGGGGLDLAVETVFGATTAWHCEIDPAASKVLAARWPGVPNLGDITQTDWTAVEPVDILCGGFPCQDVSAAGCRAGIRDGTRSGLWTYFADAIAALCPPIVIIENVRGILSARAHRVMERNDPIMGDNADGFVLRALGAVLGDLSDLGYDARWATVAAASIGAPHRRERVFILATDTQRTRQQRPADHTPSGESDIAGSDLRLQPHRCGPTPTVGQNGQWRPVAIAARDGRHEGWPEPAGQQRGSDAAVSGDRHVELLPTPQARDWKNGQSNQPDISDAIRSLLPTPTATDYKGGHDTTDPARQRGRLRNMPRELYDATTSLLPTPNAADGSRGQDFARANRDGSGGDDLITLTVKASRDSAWGKYAAAIARWEQQTRPAPAPTEPNRNNKPRLNPQFSEWMMGWPAGWATDLVGRNDALRIIGNGVVPQQATAALRRLLSVSEVVA